MDRQRQKGRTDVQAKEHEVVVVGGGQAGLAVGYHLRQAGVDFAIVDAGTEIGQVWSSRWDSLRLFTPAQYASLPGLPFPAEPGTYPAKDDVAGYLVAYVERFDLPVRLDSRVATLEREGAGFVLTLASGDRINARQVVVATGPYSVPFVPGLSADLTVPQLHTSAYRGPTQLPPGRVLVVGGGNSGFQIAAELVQAGRAVELSEGSRNLCVPQRPLGRDLFSWLDGLGLLRVTADSRIGGRMKARNQPVIGSSRTDLRRRGVAFRPRVTGASGSTVRFANGESTDVDAVLWATGYRIDDSWVRIPDALDDGRLVQRRGVSPVPGLYTVGRLWQHTQGSALLGFVQYDAAWLAGQVVAHAPSPGG
jgi:putative flavoprotein involved in K+ transport